MRRWALRRPGTARLLAAGALVAWLGVAAAQAGDPNLEHPTRVHTVAREGYTIAGLVTHLAGAHKLRHGVALFPGHPGIMRLREEAGMPRFEMAGNFLVRSRRHWLDPETLVVVVDAPSDQWNDFSQSFRARERYGRDVGALLAEIGKRHGVEEWTFVGTSEGSVSAAQAARMNPELARRVILTASLFLPNRTGVGLSSVDFSALKSSLLWVHHADDPCRSTPYHAARQYAERTRSALITVRGGAPGSGHPCMAHTEHGFVGVEPQTVAAMLAWIKTGKAPAEVRP